MPDETGAIPPETGQPTLGQQESGSAPATVQLASLPRQWRAEAAATSPEASAGPGDTSDVRRVAYAGALLDCAQELQEVLSISPRGCWEHPGVMGYQHPECGFCWHGKDGLDVPTAGEGANREPVCPRCHPQMPDGMVLVSREDLRTLFTKLGGAWFFRQSTPARAAEERLRAAAEVTR